MIAMIALVGVIMSASVSAVTTYFVTRATNQAQSEQERQKYLLETRKATYTAFLPRLIELGNAISDAVTEVDGFLAGHQDRADPVSTRKEVNRLIAVEKRFGDAVYSTELVCSLETGSKLINTEDTADQIFNDYGRFAELATAARPSHAEIANVAKHLHSAYDGDPKSGKGGYTDVNTDIVIAFRKDLQIPK